MHRLAILSKPGHGPPATQRFIIRMRGYDKDGFHFWVFQLMECEKQSEQILPT
jgi:hypothetical protein